MNPIQFQIPLTKEQQEETRQLIERLKNDSFVQQMCQQYNIPSSRLESNPWRIQKWIEQLKKCIGCKGLNNCHQKSKGYLENLVDDGLLHIEQTACKYENQRLHDIRHLQNFLVNDMPMKLATVSFDKIDFKANGTAYTETVYGLLENASKNESVYLYGQMGTGKTYLAACCANYFARNGKKVAFVNYPAFCRRMSQSVVSGEYQQEVKRLCYAHFVVFDDIGAESVTEWNRDQILFPILNERYEKGLVTWFTSNESIESLQEHFQYANKNKEETMKAARILERITSMCKVKTLTGKDRRKSL